MWVLGRLDKSVKNLLGVPLTKAQVSLLAHSPNFALVPRQLPCEEYITTVELACQKLEPHNTEEVRGEIMGALKHHTIPGRTLTKKKPRHL